MTRKYLLITFQKYLPLTFKNTRLSIYSMKLKPFSPNVHILAVISQFICVWAGVGGAGGGGGRGGCSDSHLSSSDLIVNIIISGHNVNRYLLRHLT